MDWIFTAAFVMVAMAIILRLLWSVRQQSQSLVAQKQASRDQAKPADAVHAVEGANKALNETAAQDHMPESRH